MKVITDMKSINTPERALCHLFFHFCKRDGVFGDNEIRFISARFVALGINRDVDFKQEILAYQDNRNQFTSERDYISHLVDTIKPVNSLSLFGDCAEICLSDLLITMDEQALLSELASKLGINEIQKDTIIALMVERKTLELNKIV